MNKPQLLRINNHILDEENQPEKQADKGGNAQIKSIDEIGIRVQHIIGQKKKACCSTKNFIRGKH
jgi:hypothetical protein